MIGNTYKNVQIDLVGMDGNAFSILHRCRKGMRLSGVDKSEIARFEAEATASDYDHLLRTVMHWFTCDSEDKD